MCHYFAYDCVTTHIQLLIASGYWVDLIYILSSCSKRKVIKEEDEIESADVYLLFRMYVTLIAYISV